MSSFPSRIALLQDFGAYRKPTTKEANTFVVAKVVAIAALGRSSPAGGLHLTGGESCAGHINCVTTSSLPLQGWRGGESESSSSLIWMKAGRSSHTIWSLT